MLTDAAIKALKPKDKLYKIVDRDGMYVVVQPSGSIVFRLDYRLNGRRETLTLGRYGPAGLSLARAREKPRVDDRRVLSGIVFVNRNGLRWRDAPGAYGPHKTLYNRWKRWGEAGVFTRIMEGLAAVGAEPKTVMIDATYLKAHRTASSLRVKRGISAV